MDNILLQFVIIPCISSIGTLWVVRLNDLKPEQRTKAINKVMCILFIVLVIAVSTYLYRQYSMDTSSDEIGTLRTKNITLSHDHSVILTSYDAYIKAADERNTLLQAQLNIALQSLDLQRKKYMSADIAAQYLQAENDKISVRINLLSSDINNVIASLRSKYDAEKAKNAELEGMLSASTYEYVQLERKLTAALNDYDEALRMLFFDNRNGATKNSIKAYHTKVFEFLQMKAEDGSKEAQYLVGYMLDPWYKNIYGVEKNADKAMVAYKKISDDKNAQFCIGRLYYYSYKDEYKNAAKWLLKAAYQEHEEAQIFLGYIDGKGHIIEAIPINIPDTIKRMRFWSNVNIGRMKAKEQ